MLQNINTFTVVPTEAFPALSVVQNSKTKNIGTAHFNTYTEYCH